MYHGPMLFLAILLASSTWNSAAWSQQEIKDISWEFGPPMPRHTKGQAQAVIGENIVVACGPGWIPAKAPRERGKHNHAFQLNTKTMAYETLPDAPIGIRWPQGIRFRGLLYQACGD